MIKAIIFDLGGVILKHRSDLVGYILSQLFSISKDEGVTIWNEYRVKLLTGELSWEQFMAVLRKKFGRGHSIEGLSIMETNLYKANAEIDEKVLDLVTQLKKRSKVYLLTDTIDIHDKYNKTRNIYERFDRVFKSFEEKVSKVQGKQFFLNVLKKLNVEPSSCIYIDDVEEYVKEAKSLGMKGIVFSNLKPLKKELRDLGIVW